MADIPYGKDHSNDDVIDLDDNGNPITTSDSDDRHGGQRPVFPSPSAPLDVARELYKNYRDSEDRTNPAGVAGWLDALAHNTLGGDRHR